MSAKKLYVGNLPFRTTQEELESTFSQFGSVESVVLITDRQTGRSKGFGFVSFETESSAQDALALDGKDFNGRPLRVNVAKERTDERGGGGGGGHGGRY